MFQRRLQFLLVVEAALIVGAGHAHAAVKGQYIAKFFTEGLGRAPGSSEWVSRVNQFAGGCNAAKLKSFGVEVYTSSEFNNLGYGNEAKLLALYRGALNREPEATDYQNSLNLLNSGYSWPLLVDLFFSSAEFNSLASTACNNANYGFGTNPVIAIPTGSQGFTGTRAQLQNLINNTPSGGTIFVAQRAVINIGQPLIVKSGRTLATFGSPSFNRYANMARLVRTANFNGDLIRLEPGAKLKSIWVDGSRQRLSRQPDDVNIKLRGGANTEVSNVRSDSTAGGANIQSFGASLGAPACSNHRIQATLVTGYTGSHSNNGWSDGINVSCEDVLIEGNSVVDMTDVGIIIFGSELSAQHSIARFNSVLNAGLSAFGGMSLDPWQNAPGVFIDFTGAVINNNTLWTGPSVHFDIGISVGGRAWYGNATNIGQNAQVLNNTSGASKVNVDSGINVNAMHGATVTGNSLDTTILNVSPCPTGNVVAGLSAGFASGAIQGPIVDADSSACVFH